MIKVTHRYLLGFWAFWLAVFSQAAEGPVCAVVKIEILQELALERQGFEAVMRINNNLDTLTLKELRVDVLFQDRDGNPVQATSDPDNLEAAFFIRIEDDRVRDIEGAGISGAVLDGGQINPKATGEIYWLIVPSANAVADTEELYFVGAELSYLVEDRRETVRVVPDSIRVKPLPELVVEYFLTQDVFGDNPQTGETEPVEPYTLGVRLTNTGHGRANQVTLESAQPTIIDNQQQLMIDFRLTGSYVNDQPVNNTLLLNFGDLLPASSVVGRWRAETSLMGRYQDFSATYTHAAELGGALTSVIENPETYFLVRDVRLTYAGADSVRDFLAWVGEDLAVFESEVTGNDVTELGCINCRKVLPGVATLGAPQTQGEYTVVTLTPDGTSQTGLRYFQVEDTYQASGLRLERVVRSDGVSLHPDNFWQTPVRPDSNDWSQVNHAIGLFDRAPSPSYTLYFKSGTGQNLAPQIALVPDWDVAEGSSIGFTVSASDPNGTAPTLSAQGVPPGARFNDEGGGRGAFHWQTALGQAGAYPVTFVASDGRLSSQRTATVWVLGPDQTRDQLVDNDGDGYSEAQGDWDDNDPNRYPDAPEICGDGIDQDGDGSDQPCAHADGDIDGDGDLDVRDLLLVQRHLLGILTLDSQSLSRGDIYPAGQPDGVLTVGDLLALERLVLQTIAAPEDSDGDLLPDIWEQQYGLNPADPRDASAHADNDGLSNIEEYQYGTDPLLEDTDGDGVRDDWEVAAGTNPVMSGDYPLVVTSSARSVAGAGHEYRYELVANDPDVEFRLLDAPEGAVLEQGVVVWTPTVDQAGIQRLIVVAEAEGRASLPQTTEVTVWVGNGDVNGDEILGAADRLLLQAAVLGRVMLSDAERYRADLYPPLAPDGQLNASDLLLLDRLIMGEAQ